MTIFNTLEDTDILAADKTIVTTGLWSSDDGDLDKDEVYLSSTQLGLSGDYYFDVFNLDPNEGEPDADLAEVQFAITYGHINGGGAPTLQDDTIAKLPTQVIYSQYKNLLLQPGDDKFIFDEVPTDHIYVINLQRARVREQLDPGNWQLPLSGSSNHISTFIDNSTVTIGSMARNSQAGRIFEIVSGTIQNGPYTGSNAPTGLGYVYPDLGIIVLNPDKICNVVGFYTTGSIAAPGLPTGSSATGSIYNNVNITNFNDTDLPPFAPYTSSAAWPENAGDSSYNHAGLFASLKLALYDADEINQGFLARSAETITSTHYFIRLRNREFNYSNNPTFTNQKDGTIIQPDFRETPTVYVTSIGLYNQANELLAVAKLSKPVRKSFAEELLLRVRLDF